jgi:hypothetical protein
MLKMLSIGNSATNVVLFVIFALICLSIWGILHFACKSKVLEQEVAQKDDQMKKMQITPDKDLAWSLFRRV